MQIPLCHHYTWLVWAAFRVTKGYFYPHRERVNVKEVSSCQCDISQKQNKTRFNNRKCQHMMTLYWFPENTQSVLKFRCRLGQPDLILSHCRWLSFCYFLANFITDTWTRVSLGRPMNCLFRKQGPMQMPLAWYLSLTVLLINLLASLFDFLFRREHF